MRHSLRVLAATDSIFRTATMSDEDIAKAEEENRAAKAWLDEQTRMHGGQYEHPEATLYYQRQRQEREQSPTVRERHWEDDLLPEQEEDGDFLGEDEYPPENTTVAQHNHVLSNGYRYDGNERHPEYTREVNREIRDSDGQRAWANEGHVIERNTHVTEPGQEGDHPLAWPWMHTYYPAGMDDDHGLVAGFNTPQAATRAATQLSLWGARHPESQDLLRNYYQYVGNNEPYDPSVELPHEAAMRENGERG